MAQKHRSLTRLAQRRCRPCEGGMPPMNPRQIARMLPRIRGWKHQDNAITKTFEFDDFHQTLEFVNVVGWIANQQDHHPDLEVSYRKCRVRYSTHAIGGLSENDFICAAKIEEAVKF